MALTQIQQVRLEVADFDPAFPILSDEDYSYFLTKNNNSITRTALDAAKTILLVLSQRTDDTVDIFSIKGSKAASEYRLALKMFLSDPNLNPVYNNAQGWVGGISKSEMQANNTNTDNNIILNPYTENCSKFPTSSYFEV